MTLIGGQLLAMLVLLFLQKVLLTPEQIDAWGWRIPFFIGAGLAIVVYFMRRDMHESDAFLEARALGPQESPLRALMRHPREVAIVVGLTLGGTVAFYTYTTYMQKFLVNSVGTVEGHLHRHRRQYAVFLHVPAAGGRRVLRHRRTHGLYCWHSACSARCSQCRSSPPCRTRRTRGPHSSSSWAL